MATLTLTVQPEWGRVRLEVDFTSHSSVREAWIYRVVAGVETLVRNAGPAKLSAGLATLYDTEAPLDLPFHYVMRGYLNFYPWMEDADAIGDFFVSGGTIEQSLDYVHEGNYSLKITPDGVTSATTTGRERVPVSVGTAYTFAAWLFTPTNLVTNAGIAVDWYTAGLAYISTDDSTSALFMNEWTERSSTWTAPATAAFALPHIRIASTPPANAIVYADEMRFTAAATTVTSSTITLSGESRGWLKDPLHPAVDVRLLIDLDLSPECAPQAGTYFVGIGTTTRRADSTSYDVPDAELPVTQWSRRKAPTRALRVFTRTIPDRDQMRALTASGAPLLVQLPADYNEADQVYALGEVSEDRIAADHRRPWRVHNMPIAAAHSPVGPSEGVFGTRYQDLDGFETYADAEAAGITWAEVLLGLAS